METIEMFLRKIKIMRARTAAFSYSLILLFSLCAAGAEAAPLLSTSVDWEAVSGLRLSEYKITFAGTKPAGAGAGPASGWEMYILDEFPCYGFAQYTRAWVSAKKHDGFVRVNCIRAPRRASFAYREAGENQMQGTTDGILICPVNEKQVVDLERCEKKSWKEWGRE
ncbi:MAG: hypothetical protein LBL46_03445 [Rickettsiales bacterium]|jgi:hypothetical protein|nr:hypothetical protein [Rickettsiales bacterium]